MLNQQFDNQSNWCARIIPSKAIPLYLSAKDKFLFRFKKKNVQPVFELFASRSKRSLIGNARARQLIQSKRIHVERQTTFEGVQNRFIDQRNDSNQISGEWASITAWVINLPAEGNSSIKQMNSPGSWSKPEPIYFDVRFLVGDSSLGWEEMYQSSRSVVPRMFWFEEEHQNGLSIVSLQLPLSMDCQWFDRIELRVPALRSSSRVSMAIPEHSFFCWQRIDALPFASTGPHSSSSSSS